MENSLLQEITRVLDEFAGAKSSAQALEVKGPVQEGSNFRWRMVSSRYKEVTVVVSTKKSLFGKPAPSAIEVFGLGEPRTFRPNLKDLQDFLAKAEPIGVR